MPIIRASAVHVMLALLAISCAPASGETGGTSGDHGAAGSMAGSNALSWQPFLELGDLFPSYILSTSTVNPSSLPSPILIGILVQNKEPNTKIHLVIDIEQIADRWEGDNTFPKVGLNGFYPKFKYHYQYLASIRQPITVNATFTVSINDGPPQTRTQAIRVRSVNDAVLTFRRPNGQIVNTGWAFAGFVNENNPLIDSVLRDALNIPVPIVREFVGYQRGPQDVVMQVFAIWYLFERKGFTYSSISVPSGQAVAPSQTVRFFEDSLRTQQANCIDGTVLFASILRKIGIEPIIVLPPGHAFLGFWMDSQHTSAQFLETTMMNSPGNPYRDTKPSKFRDDMARMFQTDTKLQKAAVLFNNALAYGNEEYQKNAPNFRAKAPGYQLIEIDKMRQLGVQPINH